jgi:2-haloacid dehalogenase
MVCKIAQLSGNYTAFLCINPGTSCAAIPQHAEQAMQLYRRTLLEIGTAAAAAGALDLGRSATATPLQVKAIAFDGLAVFDPRPVAALAEKIFPGRGGELSAAWRTRQFEYTWLRSMTRRYADFWTVTEQALVFAAKMLKLELGPDHRRQLMESFLGLKAWPDVPPALHALKATGFRLALLTNFSPAMIDAATSNAGFDSVFEHALSTDRVQVYKPDPRAYQMGVEVFGLKRDEILFVAFAGWDAMGAKSFGYPTYWANRQGLPAEELGFAPDAVGQDLADLTRRIATMR